MWGFIVALISGALMSIQAVGFCSLRSCLAFHRPGKCGCTLAGGQ